MGHVTHHDKILSSHYYAHRVARSARSTHYFFNRPGDVQSLFPKFRRNDFNLTSARNRSPADRRSMSMCARHADPATRIQRYLYRSAVADDLEFHCQQAHFRGPLIKNLPIRHKIRSVFTPGLCRLPMIICVTCLGIHFLGPGSSLLRLLAA